MKNHFKNKKGYTMIETVIAVSIFVVITIYGVGALLNASLLHKKSQDMRSIMDNLSFIMEDISRNARTGYNFRCLDDPNGIISDVDETLSGEDCWGIAFEPATGDPLNNNDQWVYYIDNLGNLWRATNAPYNDVSNYVQLNSEEITFTSSSYFSVLGAYTINEDPSQQQQPLIGISLVGEIVIPNKNVVTTFSLQTAISQRLLDI